MDFKKWLLKEMPLSNYKTNFIHEPYEKEGFGYNTIKNKIDKSRQVLPNTTSDFFSNQKDIEDQFSKKDRLIITHPKTFKILEEKLKDSKYNFNILLVESQKKSSVNEYMEYLIKFMKENNINQQNHITFAKNSTSGHLLTPWMILHTLGHAISEENDYNIRNIINLLEPMENINYPIASGGIKNIFNFKSVEEIKSIYDREIVHELIAEYLWHRGKIRVKKPYNNIEEIMNVIFEVEEKITEILDNCVGKIILDVIKF